MTDKNPNSAGKSVEKSDIVSPRTAYVLFIGIIIIWGVNWPIMKIGMQDIPPITFAASRMLMGAICFLALNAALGKLRLPPRQDWPVVLSVGLLQMAGFQILIYLGLTTVDAGRSAMVAYTTPLWVVPAAILILREHVRPLKQAGMVIGLTGLALLFAPWTLDWTDSGVLIGHGWLLTAAIGWAGLMLHIRVHQWQSSPLELMPWQFLVACVIGLPLALWLEAGQSINWTAQSIAILAYNGPLATAFCFWASVTVNRALPASTTSLSFLGVPMMGIASAVWLLNERLSLTDWLGIAAISAGLFIVAQADRRHKTSAPRENHQVKEKT